MPTRYGDEQLSKAWTYPTDLDGFLAKIKADTGAPWADRATLAVFLMTQVGRRMPAELRAALVGRGLLDPRAP